MVIQKFCSKCAIINFLKTCSDSLGSPWFKLH